MNDTDEEISTERLLAAWLRAQLELHSYLDGHMHRPGATEHLTRDVARIEELEREAHRCFMAYRERLTNPEGSH